MVWVLREFEPRDFNTLDRMTREYFACPPRGLRQEDDRSSVIALTAVYTFVYIYIKNGGNVRYVHVTNRHASRR